MLSGNLRDSIASRTESQWPLFISAMKLSMLSTVLRETVVSSCNVVSVRYRLFSLRYCIIRRITLQRQRAKAHRNGTLFQMLPHVGTSLKGKGPSDRTKPSSYVDFCPTLEPSAGHDAVVSAATLSALFCWTFILHFTVAPAD